MESISRKWALKPGPRHFFNFGKQPETANASKKLVKIRYFERELSKVKKRFFFLSTQSLSKGKIRKTERAWS